MIRKMFLELFLFNLFKLRFVFITNILYINQITRLKVFICLFMCEQRLGLVLAELRCLLVLYVRLGFYFFRLFLIIQYK